MLLVVEFLRVAAGPDLGWRIAILEHVHFGARSARGVFAILRRVAGRRVHRQCVDATRRAPHRRAQARVQLGILRILRLAQVVGHALVEEVHGAEHLALRRLDREQAVGRFRERDRQRPDRDRQQRKRAHHRRHRTAGAKSRCEACDAAERCKQIEATRTAERAHQQHEQEAADRGADQVPEVGAVHNRRVLLQRDRDREASEQERHDQVRVAQEQQQVLAAVLFDVERVERRVAQHHERPNQADAKHAAAERHSLLRVAEHAPDAREHAEQSAAGAEAEQCDGDHHVGEVVPQHHAEEACLQDLHCERRSRDQRDREQDAAGRLRRFGMGHRDSALDRLCRQVGPRDARREG